MSPHPPSSTQGAAAAPAGKVTDRLDKLLKILAADPNDAFVLYGIAQEYGNRGEHARAVEFYDRCITADAAYVYGYYHKAQALRQLGKTADAREVVAAGLKAATAAQDAKGVDELQGLMGIL